MSVIYWEEILLSFVNFVPYAVFIIFVFDADLKVSRVWVCSVLAISSVIDVFLWLLAPESNSQAAQIFSLITTIGSLICYIAVVKISFFHAVFRLFVINNVANFIVAEAKFLEKILFPQMAWELSRWSYSLCMFLLQIIILGGAAVFLRKQRYIKYDGDLNPIIWKFLCLIPVTFYVMWHYEMYYIGEKSSLEMALDPTYTFFQTIIFGGQILMVDCIMKLDT